MRTPFPPARHVRSLHQLAEKPHSSHRISFEGNEFRWNSRENRGVFSIVALLLMLDFPYAVAFPVFADKQPLLLKGFGYILYRLYRLPDCFCHHDLCGVWVLCQEFQNCDFLQSAVFALWTCTLGGLLFFPKDVAEPVFEFILLLKDQVLKETLQSIQTSSRKSTIFRWMIPFCENGTLSREIRCFG